MSAHPHKLTPENRCQAGKEGTVVSGRGVLPSSGSPSHAAGAVVGGLDARPPSPTPSMRDTVRASLDLETHREVYPRRVPGSPRHV
jgi:hypothetical protein